MLDVLRRAILNKYSIPVPTDYLDEIEVELMDQHIPYEITFDNKLEIDASNTSKLHAIMMNVTPPRLAPAQFNWLLATAGLETPIASLLEAMKEANSPQYAEFKAYISSARFYEFKQAIAMLEVAKPIMLQTYPTLDLSQASLLALWKQAAKF